MFYGRTSNSELYVMSNHSAEEHTEEVVDMDEEDVSE